MKLGLNPGVVQWSIVARGFAEHGDPAVVFVILKQLEGVIGSQDRGAGDDDTGAAAEPADQAQTSSFPDIGFYMNVLRGFVLARKLEHAQDMEKRLRQKFDYVEGDLKATDDALRLLRNLERQMI